MIRRCTGPKARRRVLLVGLLTAAVALPPLAAPAATKTTARKATKTTKRVAAKPKVTVKAPTPATTPATTPAATATTAASRAPVTLVQIQNGNEPVTWDPALMSSGGNSQGNRVYPVYGALFYMDPRTKRFTGLLAESLTTGDGSNWTLKMRPNLKFTDGSPVDAAAVKAHWDRIRDPATGSSSRAALLQIASMTVPDPLTLRFTLAERNQQYLWNLQGSAPNHIPSARAMAADPKSFATKPVGAGPFILKEFRREDRTVFTANPDWPFWPGGRPNIDELVIRPILDENQRYNTLNTGQAQLMFSSSFAVLKGRAPRDGHTVVPIVTEMGNTIIFNLTRPPYDDVRLRRILQLGLDKKAFQRVFCECDEDGARNMFDEQSPFYDKNADYPAYDLEAAQKLVDEISQENNGRPVEVVLGHFSTTANAVTAQILQAQYSRLRNFRMVLDGAEPVVAQTRVIRGQFGMHLWGNLLRDPDELYNMFHSRSPQNWGKYVSAAVDSGLQIGRASVSAADRKRAYADVARAINFDVPVLNYQRTPAMWIHSKAVSTAPWYHDGMLLVDQMRLAS